MNIVKYLNRLGITEKLKPSFDFLKELQKAHLFNIPFENLDIHYGKNIVLDKNHLYSKIVENKRGGFCYELNGLFYELLISLGFNVKIISARVYSKEKGYGKEFDHLALIVKISNKEYLTDVGFGDFAYYPLLINLDAETIDQAGKFRFDIINEQYFRVSKKEKGNYIPQYIFQSKKRELMEFDEMCKFHQSSPKSHFTKNRIISIATEDGRKTLTNSKMKIANNKKEDEFLILDENEFNKQLWEHFNIRI